MLGLGAVAPVKSPFPGERGQGDRDSELEVCFKNKLFLQSEATASAVAFPAHQLKTTSFSQPNYHLHPFTIDFLRKTCYNINDYKQLHRVLML
ncbi:MAG: hypothetical protein EGR86_09090 [Ruminiclostridium sp.]|nr:hypothetical protein [Ruminiclostridium sp.]